MNLWRWAGALTMVGAVMVAVTARGEQGTGDKPIWKAFDDIGKSFYQEMTSDTKQTMKVQGQTVEQKQLQTFWVKWTPKEKVDGGKGWKVEYEIIGVKMNIEIGGNPISYDYFSKDPQPANPLSDFFKALVGSKFTLTVMKDDKGGINVTKVEGIEAFVSKLTAANEQLKPLLKTILSEESFKQMTNPTFSPFPKSDEDWKKGTWEVNKIKLDMGAIGVYETSYKYTVTVDKNKLEVSGSMDYKAPAKSDSGGLPFTIKDGSKLTAEKISGTVILDPAKGWVKSSEIQMDLKGDLKIDISGIETTVELTQKQFSKVITSDTPPAGAK
ncbi:MAG TPA: DUF6263 family protein [Gemmataceae bacterium]|nr:DUF6263 family protein [Gemmataceae bacterium]